MLGAGAEGAVGARIGAETGVLLEAIDGPDAGAAKMLLMSNPSMSEAGAGTELLRPTVPSSVGAGAGTAMGAATVLGGSTGAGAGGLMPIPKPAMAGAGAGTELPRLMALLALPVTGANVGDDMGGLPEAAEDMGPGAGPTIPMPMPVAIGAGTGAAELEGEAWPMPGAMAGVLAGAISGAMAAFAAKPVTMSAAAGAVELGVEAWPLTGATAGLAAGAWPGEGGLGEDPARSWLEAGAGVGAAGCKASSSRLSIFLQPPSLAQSHLELVPG